MASTHVNFSREDEIRLTSLAKRLAEEGKARFDDDALQAEYERLQQQNEAFLLEGERRLMNASSSPITAQYGASSLTQQTTTGKVISGVSFWGSLVGKAVPAYINSLTGVLPSRKTWHFITDQLILGGIPLVNRVGSSGDHLGQLHRQIKDLVDPDTRAKGRYQLGMVAACLTQDELDGFGVPMIEFAQKFHWQSEFGTGVTYAHVPMPDGTSEVSMDVVRKAVDLIHETISERLEDALLATDAASGGEEGSSSADNINSAADTPMGSVALRRLPPKRCVYIHCKAGVGRSWMVLMCYLVTYGGRSYENAFQLVKLARPFVNPSSSQSGFVKDFAIKFEADERAKRLMAE